MLFLLFIAQFFGDIDMFYCDKCQKEFNFEKSIFKVYTECDICNKFALCHDTMNKKPKKKIIKME